MVQRSDNYATRRGGINTFWRTLNMGFVIHHPQDGEQLTPDFVAYGTTTAKIKIPFGVLVGDKGTVAFGETLRNENHKMKAVVWIMFFHVDEDLASLEKERFTLYIADLSIRSRVLTAKVLAKVTKL